MGPPDRARRRAAFLGIAGLIAAATLVFALVASRGPDPDIGPHDRQPGTPSSAVVDGNTDAPSPWLAWISGGFPNGFRERVARSSAPELDTVVVVAGDTRWLTSSEDADGTPVDRPADGFAIPIDAFAVDPDEYAPFLPADVREEVVAALAAGEGVLGSGSAELRGLSAGGTMHFDGRSVHVGAVAPDEAIGWSELLVSRETGRGLGIVDERYLLALPASPTDRHRMEALIEGSLPGATALRLVPPGGTDFVRVGSGVEPPVVMKETFGEFSARMDPSDPASFTIDPAWIDEHLATRSVPLLGRVTCNEELFPRLVAALEEIEDQGLGDLVRTYDGCFSARTVARSPTAAPSQHAYGAAIDIDAFENAYGAEPSMDPRIVAIFERHGFLWGGRFLVPDGMHFEAGWGAGG